MWVTGTHYLHEAGVKTFDDQPNDIVFDRCVFQGGFTDNTMSRLLALHARKVELLNSFLEGGRSAGSDAQAIAGWNGKGPYLIHNNYIDGTTENIMFGGATPFVDDTVQSGEIRYNYLPHPEERWRVVKWSPRLKVLAGRVVQATGSLALYISITSGFTGASEPLWPASAGKTTTDGDIVWKCWTENASACTAGNNPWTIKNNFELKSARNMHIHHNVFDQLWVDAQETQVNLKNENRGPGFGTCVPEYSGRVDTKTDGQKHLVIARSGYKLPRLVHTTPIGGIDPYQITINGAVYTIVTGSLNQPDSDQQLPLTTSAGVQTDVPFSYGQPLCHAAWLQNILFENNSFVTHLKRSSSRFSRTDAGIAKAMLLFATISPMGSTGRDGQLSRVDSAPQSALAFSVTFNRPSASSTTRSLACGIRSAFYSKELMARVTAIS